MKLSCVSQEKGQYNTVNRAFSKSVDFVHFAANESYFWKNGPVSHRVRLSFGWILPSVILFVHICQCCYFNVSSSLQFIWISGLMCVLIYFISNRGLSGTFEKERRLKKEGMKAHTSAYISYFTYWNLTNLLLTVLWLFIYRLLV